MQLLLTLIEYSEQIYIPDQIWQDQRIQRLMELCNLCVSLANDVYSFEKEYVEQKEDMSNMNVNIVGFHVLKYKCSVTEAMKKSFDVVKKYECQYKELADCLIKDQSISSEVKKFVVCVTAVIAGNIDLSTRCNRYNKIYEVC